MEITAGQRVGGRFVVGERVEGECLTRRIDRAR